MRWLVFFALVGCDDGSILEPDTADGTDGTDLDGTEVDTEVDLDTSGDTDPPVSTVDYRQPGSRALTEASGSLTVPDCALEYTTFTPTGGETAPLVVLGHGFARNKSNMVDVARHIASHGLRVVTPTYCHSRILDADHAQNGVDAILLSAALAGSADVVHMGFSAGGASAFVAANGDARSVGVFGLDAVDSDGIAVGAIAGIDVPVFGVVGQGSNCNSDNNGVDIYAADADAVAVRLPGATHCDFEGPTGLSCTLLCGGESADPKVTARALASAFAASVTGVDPGASVWVTPGGDAYQDLLDDGDIAPL